MDDPNDWFDVTTYFIGSIPGILAAILAWRIKAQTAEIGEQVTNDHPTNLRDDLDVVRDLVERVVDRLDDLGDRFDELSVKMVEIDSRTKRIGGEQRIDRDRYQKMERDFYQLAAETRRIVAKHHPEESI